MVDSQRNLSALPVIPKFDAVERALGAPVEAYLDDTLIQTVQEPWRWLMLALRLYNKPWHGEDLSLHGLRFKPEIDAQAAANALYVWLTPWEPSEKIFNTVGYVLSQWCERSGPIVV